MVVPGYWWSRYGDFSPGIGVYPHVGQIIAHYRVKRGFRRQEDLATALGCSKRVIEELEGAASVKGPDSLDRRQVLARLLRIPPALLALDWRFMMDHGKPYGDEELASRLQAEDDAFTPYQNILLMARGYLYNGGPSYIADIVDDSLEKISPIAEDMPDFEKEPWLEMLCRYYQLSSSFALRHLDKNKAYYYAQKAIEIAGRLENLSLLAASHYRCVRVHLDLRKYAGNEEEKQERLINAKAEVQECLKYIEDVGPILKGNIYLIASEVYALSSQDEMTKRKCNEWQRKAETLVYRNDDREDETFLRLNATALHHEKAKTRILFGDYAEAHNEIVSARKTLNADLLTWHANLNITEARLYYAQGDLEASSSMALEAYRVAKVVQSPKEIEEVKRLWHALNEKDTSNPSICNLGLALGLI
jgi:transcriptional regulator with XRE-family HTH domain